MKIQPTADYVFLSIEEKKQEKGGIILSDVSRDKQPIGTIEAIGPDVHNLKVGDQVIFNAFIVKEIEVQGEKLFLLKSKDIYATWKK